MLRADHEIDEYDIYVKELSEEIIALKHCMQSNIEKQMTVALNTSVNFNHFISNVHTNKYHSESCTGTQVLE